MLELVAGIVALCLGYYAIKVTLNALRKKKLPEVASVSLVPWTIQIMWTERDNQGKKFQARSVFWAEAKDIPSAYKQAESLRERYPDVKFGAIMRGHHQRLP